MIPTFIAVFPSIELNRLSDAASRAAAAALENISIDAMEYCNIVLRSQNPAKRGQRRKPVVKCPLSHAMLRSDEVQENLFCFHDCMQGLKPVYFSDSYGPTKVVP